ncbi:hypothetical protein [Piscirickettsia salmonis]|uniref:hypothetical protein n=1 Tax=Piscirickettsia salmonis TaxID=1238 RepID=UPI003A808181
MTYIRDDLHIGERGSNNLVYAFKTNKLLLDSIHTNLSSCSHFYLDLQSPQGGDGRDEEQSAQ